MADNQKRILEMLAEKKITVEEAEKLLALIGSAEDAGEKSSKTASHEKQSHKYLRVVVQPGAGGTPGHHTEKVNVRVPMNLIRAGMKLTALIPSNAAGKVSEALKEKGIDFDLRNLKADDIEELVAALSDLEVDVQNGKEAVRIYVE